MVSVNCVFFKSELSDDLVLGDDVDAFVAVLDAKMEASRASWTCNSSANLASTSVMMSSLSSCKSTSLADFHETSSSSDLRNEPVAASAISTETSSYFPMFNSFLFLDETE